jgi:predicted nucleic acid-binding protein
VSFLLDTNVLSELRKGRRCDPNVTRWMDTVDDLEIHTSVVVLGELKRGIERVRPKNPTFAGELERWLTRMIVSLGRRVLPVDQAVALAWGVLSAPRTVPPIDGLLAATAMVHGHTIVTRNVKDMADLGVSYLNPFEPLR